MQNKRERKEEINEDENLSSSDESMGDTDEEITFDAMTKEERKKKQEMNGSNIEDDDDDEDEDEEMINVDFEFSDPKEAHFKSIRNFLRYMLLGSAKNLDYSPLAEAIVNQVEAGSMVQISGEDDVYGFLSILSIRYHKDNACLKEILSIIGKRCPGDKKKQFETYLTKQTGFLFNERMRNFPAEIMPHLYSSLGEDITWALENSDTKDAFKFEYILILSPCYVDKSKMKGKKGKKAKLDTSSDYLFFHFEDQVIKKYASLSFSFDVAQLADETLSESLQQARLVMIVPFSSYPDIVTELQGLM